MISLSISRALNTGLTVKFDHSDPELSAILSAGTRIFPVGELVQRLKAVGIADQSHVNGEQLWDDISQPSLPLVRLFASVAVFSSLGSSRIEVDKITLLIQILGDRYGA